MKQECVVGGGRENLLNATELRKATPDALVQFSVSSVVAAADVVGLRSGVDPTGSVALGRGDRLVVDDNLDVVFGAGRKAGGVVDQVGSAGPFAANPVAVNKDVASGGVRCFCPARSGLSRVCVEGDPVGVGECVINEAARGRRRPARVDVEQHLMEPGLALAA